MKDLHAYYDKLTENEKNFVDKYVSQMFHTSVDDIGYTLQGNDSAERAVDAIAHWVIESR